MEYRSLGKCGTRVSALGLGGWTTFGGSVRDQDVTREIITAAYESGVNFFDIADVYSNGEAEKFMGKVLGEFSRRTLVISSKLYFPFSDDVNDRGLSRKHIMESIEDSLYRIGTDYLDIYFCHRFDEETPLEETVRAMDDLVKQGKILFWGTSEWTGEQIEQAHQICRSNGYYPPQVEQPQYSLLYRAKFESNVQPAVKECGMGAVTWSPLASGMLTGKYDDGIPDESRLSRIDWLKETVYTDENLEKVRKFKALADAAGHPRARLALAWALLQPGVSSVLMGATSRTQLEENLKALDVSIGEDLAEEIDHLFGYPKM